MVRHRIILNSSLREPTIEWQEVLNQSYPEATHPDRIQGFYSSRNALLDCLQRFHPKASTTDLLLNDVRGLQNFPDMVVSLTHSTFAGAAAAAKRTEYISIGIDIEPIDRLVKESILARVTTTEDLKLSSIQIWCLKEAIYKCVSNSHLYEGVLEFRDMRIQDRKWSHSPSKLSGEWELFEEENHQIALATLKNQNS
jgi:phosphopantetheinyl transferase (holo-ACP synthase)